MVARMWSRVVPPGGDPLAAEPPFFGDSGVSIQATWYNLGKRLVHEDVDGLRAVIASADVLIEDWAPGGRLLSDEVIAGAQSPRLCACPSPTRGGSRGRAA